MSRNSNQHLVKDSRKYRMYSQEATAVNSFPNSSSRVPGSSFSLLVTSLLCRRKHFFASLQRQCIVLFQFLPPTLDVCSRQIVQPLNGQCSRMASLEHSPWAFSLVHFDSVDLVQVKEQIEKKKQKLKHVKTYRNLEGLLRAD